jgi:hypothetical protein
MESHKIPWFQTRLFETTNQMGLGGGIMEYRTN